MLCGLPGSGKSTYAAKLHRNYGYQIHSSDELRKTLFNDINEQNQNNILFDNLHKNIKSDLLNGKNVVYDATNISRKQRIHFLNSIKHIPCIKYCVLIPTPYDICLKNNKQRERSVPIPVIAKMYKSFQIPYYRDGFDAVLIDSTQLPSELNAFEKIKELSNIEQDNPYHTYSIGEHCKRAAKYIIEHNGDKILKWAALLHDIGKPFCKSFTDTKGNPSKYAHYYGHENVSAYLSLGYLKKYFSNTEDILKVAYIINHHMRLLQIEQLKNSNIIKNRLREQVGNEIMQYLTTLYAADKAAT